MYYFIKWVRVWNIVGAKFSGNIPSFKWIDKDALACLGEQFELWALDDVEGGDVAGDITSR